MSISVDFVAGLRDVAGATSTLDLPQGDDGILRGFLPPAVRALGMTYWRWLGYVTP